ncbi:MAG: lipase family protein [Chloroflexi bacterium]|nr:lipase family protein [Chloroflexota bacterium]
MYYPPQFDKARAIELCQLVDQAYQHFENFKQAVPWKLQGNFKLVGEILYHTILSFDAQDESDTTVVDKEIQELPVSFGLSLDSLVGKDIPMGFVAVQDKTVFLVFRGTVTPREWLFDASIGIQPYRLAKWGNVSSGFMKIYNRCRDSFIKTLAGFGPDYQLFITGHSLGGALSLLALPDVIKSTSFKKPISYTFGCPRVGDNDFAKAYDALPNTRTFRVVNTSDLVTSIPLPVQVPLFPSGNYTHVGIPVDFTFQGNSLGLNHSTATYISALSG